MTAGRPHNPGLHFGYVSSFSIRYHLACKAISELERFSSSSPLAVLPFDADELIQRVTQGRKGSSGKKPIGQNVLKIIEQQYSNSISAVSDYRREGFFNLRPFSIAVVRYAFNRQISEMTTHPILLTALEHSTKRLLRSFHSIQLYRNRLFAPEVPVLSFNAESIMHGLQKPSFSGLKWKDARTDFADILGSFKRKFAATQTPENEENTTPALSPAAIAIINDYRETSERLPARFLPCDEEAVISQVMTNKEPTFRTPGQVLSVLRHDYSNYDRLYLSEEVRSGRYWMLTGHSAAKRSVYLQMLSQARTDALRLWLESAIESLDRAVETKAIQATRCRDTEWFIRNAYIVSVSKNIQSGEKLNMALSYAR